MSRGYFGIGIWYPKVDANVGTLWRSALAFGASYLFTVGKRYSKQPTDTAMTPLHLPLFHYVDIDDLVKHLPRSSVLIGVENIETAVNLDEFEHPEQAVYLLGSEGSGLGPEVISCCHSVVQIPTRQCVNVAVAGSIVLYDRQCQQRANRATAKKRHGE